MANSELIDYIFEDVQKYNGVRRPLKAGIIERLLTRKVSPLKMHVNPNDEFAHPDVGPNMSIVMDYGQVLKRALAYDEPLFRERIVIEKMYPDGYMILNGHHRWAAAYKNRVGKVRVQLVNSTHEEDVNKMLDQSRNDKRVTFDFDDIVLAKEGEASDAAGFICRLFFRKMNIRLNAAALMREFSARGYDIWVFTSEYYSRPYIEKLFKLHGIRTTGVLTGVGVNDAGNHKKNVNLIKALSDRYRVSLTVFKDSISYADSSSGDFGTIELENGLDTDAGIILGQIKEAEEKRS